MPLTATCHCGATRIELAHAPRDITECNCSFCFKRGALWAYYAPDQVAVVTGAEVNTGYSSSPEMHTHHHCSVCGCTTYSTLRCSWTDDGPDFDKPRISVNARLFDDFDIATLPSKKLDGRNDW